MDIKRKKVFNMVMIAAATAIIVLCSWLSLPGAVPSTMQTFAIFTVLGLLGGRRGTISVVLYIFLGILGLPVFSQFKGGIGTILHDVSGGYIIGFLLLALLYWGVSACFGNGITTELFALLCGLGLCYATGACWYTYINVLQDVEVDVYKVLLACVAPFIIPDLVKLSVSVLVVRRLRRAMPFFRPTPKVKYALNQCEMSEN